MCVVSCCLCKLELEDALDLIISLLVAACLPACLIAKNNCHGHPPSMPSRPALDWSPAGTGLSGSLFLLRCHCSNETKNEDLS